MVWARDKKRRTCQDSPPGNSERRKKERKTKEEMGGQYHRMDRVKVSRGCQTCGKQRGMEISDLQLNIGGVSTAMAMGLIDW